LSVYEDANTIAFMELHPSASGHVMVILKKHGNNILEYSEGELEYSWQVCKRLQKRLKMF